MDIKIGFTDSPRELTIATDASQDEVRAKVAAALEAESGVLELSDDRGRQYLVRNSRIAYVEIGAANARTVGFIG
ncbi:DUF3107 domain-containing protein [Corynebacterium epidermidicanis]|uniref:Putative DUF3107 family protein n=1 Tax=Corynebacterium epidermidicanis TaxID=1050174 RepID=A0A0G3GPN7_9CORY|nr:DUF3107 domain-containing protein [Corynebacterium epidermidicanis]AKK02555.1 putative DUF3107 family protein [Corynebacterium epidermidicanis]